MVSFMISLQQRLEKNEFVSCSQRCHEYIS
jgi:hypothetical protein